MRITDVTDSYVALVPPGSRTGLCKPVSKPQVFFSYGGCRNLPTCSSYAGRRILYAYAAIALRFIIVARWRWKVASSVALVRMSADIFLVSM